MSAETAPPTQGSRATPPADDWTAMDGSPGWWVRPLLETKGRATQLMRVEAGVVSEPHSHDRWEQVYLIEGSLTDPDGTTHRPGTFLVRAPGAVHGGISHDGATMLVIYGDVA